MQSRTYQYSYTLRSTFVPPIDWHFFKLRVVPCSNAFQRVCRQHLEIAPKSHYSKSRDCFGNKIQWGSFDYLHDSFTVVSTGVVKQIGQYAIIERPKPFYLASTHLTTCDDEMISAVQSLTTPLEIMHFVHEWLTYTPCVTTPETTACDVFHGRKGVCQDFAHLMIAICRTKGIFARYVNGFIIGEGQTHAWVEVSDGRVWYAYDPTHDREIFWDYIKIAHGRDADDCPTNRGRMFSWTSEIMTINTKLDKINPKNITEQ